MRKNLLTMDIILAKEIKYMLEKENYLPGDKLPSERILSERFHVQRSTIRSALALLIQEKCILSQERKGYFVAPKRIMISTRQFTRNYHSENRGRQLQCHLHQFEEILTDKRLSGKMLLPEGTPVFKVTRIYYEDRIPLSIDYSFTPADLYPALTREQIQDTRVLDFLRNTLQIEISKSNQKVTLIYTNEQESKLLQVPPGSPLMKYKGLVYDSQGRLVHFFENIMKMDDFAFIREAEKRKTWNKTRV